MEEGYHKVGFEGKAVPGLRGTQGDGAESLRRAGERRANAVCFGFFISVRYVQRGYNPTRTLPAIWNRNGKDWSFDGLKECSLPSHLYRKMASTGKIHKAVNVQGILPAANCGSAAWKWTLPQHSKCKFSLGPLLPLPPQDCQQHPGTKERNRSTQRTGPQSRTQFMWSSLSGDWHFNVFVAWP